jgi:high-affinity nickel-transport protein
MGGFVLLLHLVGWGTLVFAVAPQHYQLTGTLVFGLGAGLTVYLLGARHAFDADHIAAIDNTTRALLGGRRRPLTVGFWFALGHSSIVFALCALLVLGIRAFLPGGSATAFQETAGAIGLSVSAGFLLLVGVLNLGVLVGIVRVQRRSRAGVLDEQAMEEQLRRRGLLTRVLGRATRAVTRPWHMFPVGLLFGLGFDTFTEVSLLVLAGGAASAALPWYAIMTLPVLFAAGMTLLDSADGVAMSYAYDWAFARPGRRVFYNLSITSLSVVVALGIGGLQLMALLTEQLGLRSGPIAWLGSLDLGSVGFAVVGLFLLAWASAVLVWRAAGRRRAAGVAAG